MNLCKSRLILQLFHIIYPHKERYFVIPKIESENIACIVPHESPLLFDSHLGFSGDKPIDLNCERLQAPWRALAFREKELDGTPSARIVEHASGISAPPRNFKYECLSTSLDMVTGHRYNYCLEVFGVCNSATLSMVYQSTQYYT